MAPRKFFVGGNFKMNGTTHTLMDIVKNLNDADLDPNAEIVIAPPSLYLRQVRDSVKPNISTAAQNVFDRPNGAFTGEISVSQLQDLEIPYVIIGHSERRTVLQEDNKFVARKTKAALAGGISVILCIGESLEEREALKTIDVVTSQLHAVAEEIAEPDWSRVVIAYEPIWAIGTGKVATSAQAQEAHAAIRAWLTSTVSPGVGGSTRIIYGGSVNAKNCSELAQQSDIDGFLVGGASLKPEFIDIVNSRRQS